MSNNTEETTPLVIDPQKVQNRFGKTLNKRVEDSNEDIPLGVGDRVSHKTFGYSAVMEIKGKIVTLKPAIKPSPNSTTVRVIYDSKFR